MADQFAVRGYEMTVENHRHNAERALTYAKQHVDRALASISNDDPGSLTYEGRQAVAYSAEAWAHLQALKALYDVRFLTESGEGEGNHE